MTNLQKKALGQAFNILNSVDSFPVYKALIEAMTAAGIENNIITSIANKFQSAMLEQTKKASEAQMWIDSIIKDETL
jgi:hypothetical protein